MDIVSIAHCPRSFRQGQLVGDILGCFHCSFDLKIGNSVTFFHSETVKQKDLEGFEFTVLPAGSHHVYSDSLLFQCGRYWGISAYVQIKDKSQPRGSLMGAIGFIGLNPEALFVHQNFLSTIAEETIRTKDYSKLLYHLEHHQTSLESLVSAIDWKQSNNLVPVILTDSPVIQSSKTDSTPLEDLTEEELKIDYVVEESFVRHFCQSGSRRKEPNQLSFTPLISPWRFFTSISTVFTQIPSQQNELFPVQALQSLTRSSPSPSINSLASTNDQARLLPNRLPATGSLGSSPNIVSQQEESYNADSFMAGLPILSILHRAMLLGMNILLLSSPPLSAFTDFIFALGELTRTRLGQPETHSSSPRKSGEEEPLLKSTSKYGTSGTSHRSKKVPEDTLFLDDSKIEGEANPSPVFSSEYESSQKTESQPQDRTSNPYPPFTPSGVVTVFDPTFQSTHKFNVTDPFICVSSDFLLLSHPKTFDVIVTFNQPHTLTSSLTLHHVYSVSSSPSITISTPNPNNISILNSAMSSPLAAHLSSIVRANIWAQPEVAESAQLASFLRPFVEYNSVLASTLQQYAHVVVNLRDFNKYAQTCTQSDLAHFGQADIPFLNLLSQNLLTNTIVSAGCC
ncbi:hypothetical protein BLNAU_1514 [Blattamonas nauphoetae]|uniref:Uncharacterized protein n=1 Tax=Blattamonas nauphoetae TaxID=2049346 RepID=A0ABQ9YII9_9EUKA|nr:hypothetical protein BLNAU_1514 [Blattamonas nauphoetae]